MITEIEGVENKEEEGVESDPSGAEIDLTVKVVIKKDISGIASDFKTNCTKIYCRLL